MFTRLPSMFHKPPSVAPTLIAVLGMIGVSNIAAQPNSIVTESGTINIEVVATDLVHPWAIAFLPDGNMLVTERTGNLRIVSENGDVSEPLEGVPDVYNQGQGGLLDVALHPNFDSNDTIYLSYAEPGPGGASTAVAQAQLNNNALENVKVIFRQQPKVDSEYHFGGRLVFTEDNKLFITMGERFKFDPAQNVGNHLGTIVRVNLDGSVPDDNPFVDHEDALPEIWSYGHRNIEAAALHPDTGQLWVTEMGPQGGDELNIAEPGRNYGWPVVSWGEHYDGRDIPDPPTHPEFEDAVKQWTPVISPSGMIYYTGDLISQWQNNFLIGGLSSQALIRVSVDGNQVTDEAKLEMGARIRDVAQGPNGAVYLLTDEENGKLLRLTPQ